MRLGSFEHLEPKTLSEACSILAEHGSKAGILAGGTDLLVRMQQGVATPQFVVNIKQVEGLTRIQVSAKELRIGAATTLTDIYRSPVVRERVPILAEAALSVGAAQLQNMGTIGGNLCLAPRCWYYQQGPAWRDARPPCLKLEGNVCYMAKSSKRCYALYSGDTAAALLALDARVRLVSLGQDRTLPLQELYVDEGLKNTVLRADELLAEVIIPAPAAGQRGTYLKFRKRGAVDFPIAGVGAVLTTEARLCHELRIAVTGAGSIPFLVKGVQELAAGKQLTPELIGELAEAAWKQARPVSQMEVPAWYRRRLVKVLVKDALQKLAGPQAV